MELETEYNKIGFKTLKEKYGDEDEDVDDGKLRTE